MEGHGVAEHDREHMMLIQTHSLEDFIENLDSAEVYLRQVFVDVTRVAATADRHCSSWEIHFQASVVLIFDGSSDAGLQCGINCGVDRTSKPVSMEGSIEANRLRDLLSEHCSLKGLTVKPGILSF
jgi:hypothetical protein